MRKSNASCPRLLFISSSHCYWFVEHIDARQAISIDFLPIPTHHANSNRLRRNKFSFSQLVRREPKKRLNRKKKVSPIPNPVFYAMTTDNPLFIRIDKRVYGEQYKKLSLALTSLRHSRGGFVFLVT